MFYNSSKFKTLEAGVSLSWLQQKLSTQNTANTETPGYKAKHLSFAGVLNAVTSETEKRTLSRIDAAIVTSDEISTRPDGNNVSVEAESLSLYKAYSQYSMLLNQIGTEFDKYSYVLNVNM